MPSPVGELLCSLAGTLKNLGLRWYLFGAQAAVIHGSPRLTADVDVTVQLGDVDVTTLVAALAGAGFDLRVSNVDDFVRRTRVLPVVHTGTGIPVDIVLGGPGPEELFLQRARNHLIDDTPVPVACAEDIVVMKILAGRPKDLEDTDAILAAQMPTIDLGLVRDTLRMLEEALSQSDLTPALEQALLRARK